MSMEEVWWMDPRRKSELNTERTGTTSFRTGIHTKAYSMVSYSNTSNTYDIEDNFGSKESYEQHKRFKETLKQLDFPDTNIFYSEMNIVKKNFLEELEYCYMDQLENL